MRKYHSPKGTIPQTAPVQTTPVQFNFTGKAAWALAIIALMVFSAVGYYYADRQDLAPGYQGFRFSLNPDNTYTLKWQGARIAFTYHPTELLQIPVTPNTIPLLQNSRQVLLTFDANSTEPAMMDALRLRLAERFSILGIALGTGVLTPDPNYPFPAITCSNATTYIPVLELRTGEREGITREGSCITLTGVGTELAAVGERLEYGLLGVMV